MTGRPKLRDDGPSGRACPRLDRLETHPLDGGLLLAVARGPRSRMLGLAWLDDMPEEYGLLIPRCGSVHTFGMRFPIDVILLDRACSPVRVAEGVPQRRLVRAARAKAVVETRAGGARRFLDAGLTGVVEAARARGG